MTGLILCVFKKCTSNVRQQDNEQMVNDGHWGYKLVGPLGDGKAMWGWR